MQRPNLNKYPLVTRVVVLLVLAVLGVMAYRAYGWPGIALGLGALVMWMLMHMSRMLLVLRRTAQRPVGTVASAVMLHARLQRGMALLQVLTLTQALGQRMDNPESDHERYQWTDGSQATVCCTFAHGKLVHWELLRP
ncbi:MAG: glycerate kinase [Pseudomonadota bacterium]